MGYKVEKEYYNFLCAIDQDFPVPISYKVDLKEYAKKIDQLANTEFYIEDNKIVGMVVGYIDNCNDNIAYISLVGVLKDYRRRNIAANLLKSFICKCKDRDILKIHLYTDIRNTKAINMYKKLGFYEKKLINDKRPEDVHLFYDINKGEDN